MEVISKWDMRFLHLAKMIGSWSKDPRRKVGAVITKDNFLVSVGYNGFPKNVLDKEERYNDRDIKLNLVLHAETNAILNAKSNLDGCTIYIYPLFPCNDCAKIIVQSGIKRIVSINCESLIDISDYWREKIYYSKLMFDEAGIEYKEYNIDFIEETFHNEVVNIPNYSYKEGGNK